MAIQFEIDGIPFTVGSASEAKAVVTEFRRSTPANSTSAPPANTPRATVDVNTNGNAHDDFWEFLSGADDKGRALIALVAEEFPRPVAAEAIAKPLGAADRNEVGWVKRKLGLLADKHGVALGRYIQVTKLHIEGRPKTAYRASPALMAILRAVEHDNGRATAL